MRCKRIANVNHNDQKLNHSQAVGTVFREVFQCERAIFFPQNDLEGHSDVYTTGWILSRHPNSFYWVSWAEYIWNRSSEAVRDCFTEMAWTLQQDPRNLGLLALHSHYVREQIQLRVTILIFASHPGLVGFVQGPENHESMIDEEWAIGDHLMRLEYCLNAWASVLVRFPFW